MNSLAEAAADLPVVHLYSTEQVFEMHPVLRDAVPPVPAHHERDRINFPDEFARIMREGFKTPEPVGTQFALISAAGVCLSPLLTDKDWLVFDPLRPAQDGDVVLLMYRQEAYTDLLEKPEAKAFEKEMGFRPPVLGAKLLWAIDGDYAVSDRETGIWADDFKILGTLVCVERDGRQLYFGE